MTQIHPFTIFEESPDLPKAFRNGTHRQQDPVATLARIKPFLGTFGITRVANVTGLDRIGIPVTMVCRPNSRSVAVSQGKGLTLAAAKASGIMESIELWHAEHMQQPLRYCSYREIQRAGRVVNVERLAGRLRSRFHSNLPILWVAGYDLLARQESWLPFECVTMDSTLPLPAGAGCFLGTSNGLASGNNLLEAMSHAICEVVERDATTLWRARGASETHEDLVDLASVNDWACREVLQHCAAAEVQVLAWNITSDTALPAFAALITELGVPQPIRVTAIGYGCHVDRGVALLRALTEAIQSRLTYISGSRDDLFRREYEDNIRTRQSIGRFWEMLQTGQGQPFQSIPTYNTETFNDDVTLQLARLKAVGIEEVVAIDLTDPSINIPVVRVVVPGLEGPDSDPDYVPGERVRNS